LPMIYPQTRLVVVFFAIESCRVGGLSSDAIDRQSRDAFPRYRLGFSTRAPMRQ
jgi:hypothetical protein